MMQIYLVQHGAAKTEAEDPQRGLTEEGRRTVERIAEFLAPIQLALERIEHSEKLRARQTAEILAVRLRPTEGTKQAAGMAPNDDVEPVRARLEKESKTVMLVGHLPYLSRLLARLLGWRQSNKWCDFRWAEWFNSSERKRSSGPYAGCWCLSCSSGARKAAAWGSMAVNAGSGSCSGTVGPRRA